MTIDIEKAFDELDHDLEHESFVIKGEATTQYFRLQRYSRPGDSIPAYLFMLYLQILFVLIKNNQNTESVSIFENTYLFSPYADDSTYFLKNLHSLNELLKTIGIFLPFTDLKPNLRQYEICGICALKGVTVALCGIKCIYLDKEL